MEKDEKIERYLSGQMNGDEKADFENEMKNDPVLMKNVELDKALVEQIKYHAFLEKQILHGKKELKRHKNLQLTTYTILSLAAVLLILFFIPGIWQQNNYDKLFASAYQVYPNDYLSVDATFRGDTMIDSLELAAMTAYENKDFLNAESKIKEILQTGENHELRFFLSITQLENGKTDDAIESLQALYSLPENFKYYEQTRWYLALAWIKLNNKEEAKRLLNELSEIEGYYWDKAKVLKEKM
jgi:tetratricopeptide (TPR) repeat protein